MKQFILTTAMGKRLIGKGMAAHPTIRRVLTKGTLLIVAGTTNGYVAQEILTGLGQAEGFTRLGFRRGITIAPGARPARAELAGDVIVVDGVWLKDRTLENTVDDLQEGDVVLKGANAFDGRGQAAVQIGHPKGGTIMAVLPAIVGRRVQLIVPVGLEKRVLEDVDRLVRLCNAPGVHGPRLMPLPGPIYTELDAIEQLTGAQAHLLAGGGIYGAEGGAWLGIAGTDDQMAAAESLLDEVAGEPPCAV